MLDLDVADDHIESGGTEDTFDAAVAKVVAHGSFKAELETTLKLLQVTPLKKVELRNLSHNQNLHLCQDLTLHLCHQQ